MLYGIKNKRLRTNITNKQSYPIIGVKDMVVMPDISQSVTISRDMSVQAYESVRQNSTRYIVIALQKANAKGEYDINYQPNVLTDCGTLCMVLGEAVYPDKSNKRKTYKLKVQGVTMVKMVNYLQMTPYLLAETEELVDKDAAEDQTAINNASATMKEEATKLIASSSNEIGAEIKHYIDTSRPEALASFLLGHLTLEVGKKYEIMTIPNLLDRIREVSALVTYQTELNLAKKEVEEELQKATKKTQ